MSGERELMVGELIRDNDPRKGLRVLKIIEILPNGVRAKRGGAYPDVTILRRRIYTDGKPRRSGFSLVQEEA